MLLLTYIAKKIIQKNMPSRQEGHRFLKYLDLEDFPGLKRTRFEFYSKKNKIVGYRYFYEDGPYKALVTYHHGFGGGHRAYITEIASLAKQGFLVYAYDNSTCCESGGEGFFSFTQALVDQKYFYKFLDTDECAKGLKRYSCGHSWGGFTSACSLIDDSYKVEKVVAMSAFNDVISISVAHFPPLKPFVPILRLTQLRYFGRKGLVKVSNLLAKTDKEVLMISGDRDETVNYEKNFVFFQSKTKGKDNVHYLVSKDRYHQPYNTRVAQNYYYELCKLCDEGKIAEVEVDYKKLTEEDGEIMNAIYDFYLK